MLALKKLGACFRPVSSGSPGRAVQGVEPGDDAELVDQAPEHLLVPGRLIPGGRARAQPLPKSLIEKKIEVGHVFAVGGAIAHLSSPMRDSRRLADLVVVGSRGQKIPHPFTGGIW